MLPEGGGGTGGGAGFSLGDEGVEESWALDSGVGKELLPPSDGGVSVIASAVFTPLTSVLADLLAAS